MVSAILHKDCRVELSGLNAALDPASCGCGRFDILYTVKFYIGERVHDEMKLFFVSEALGQKRRHFE